LCSNRQGLGVIDVRVGLHQHTAGDSELEIVNPLQIQILQIQIQVQIQMLSQQQLGQLLIVMTNVIRLRWLSLIEQHKLQWDIVERNRPLFEGLNSDSDSELYIRESSQFESMEGIEGGSEVTGAGGMAGIDGSSEVHGGGEAKVTRYGRRVKQATFRLWEAK
jgi:hypothetical protein